MMSAECVLNLTRLLAEAKVDLWLDGGWGVDALLESQTRPHDDLDLVISLADAGATQIALESNGFHVSEDERPTRFVMQDDHGRRIDFHPVAFEPDGGGIQTLQDGRRFRYPPEGFLSIGRILGVEARCLSPEVQVLCHTGYEPDDHDRHDVRLLHERFGIPLPQIYQVPLRNTSVEMRRDSGPSVPESS